MPTSHSDHPKRKIKVFIASPGDLAEERRAFKEVIDDLNDGFGDGANVEFVPLGWEDALSQVGRRSQAVINEDIDMCDVFILTMWRRWGQEAPDAAPYSGYTEEEFYRALARFERTKAPHIFVFFKNIEAAQMADPGPQLTKVLAFRRKLEQTRKVLYRTFADDGAFKLEVANHLRTVARGDIATPDGDVCVPILPDSIETMVAKHKEEARCSLIEIARLKEENERLQQESQQAKRAAETAEAQIAAAEQLAAAKLERRALDLAESASRAALDGRIEVARQDFAKALDGSTNVDILFLGYEFFKRVGELDEAERILRRWLSVSGPDEETSSTAAAYGNLGLIERTRGNLDAAEAYQKKALAINAKLGRQTGRASAYGNLGLIEKMRGNLGPAEAYQKKSLAINSMLGRQEGIASACGNLGLIEYTRGNLDAAEAYHKKALAINEKLGIQEGIASTYGNLGLIEETRGNLDAAEAYFKKALAIEEKLEKQEGMAATYGNLGLIEETRGNLDAAEAYQKKALAINEKLGRQAGMASQYGNLGVIESTRGNLDSAETYHKKSLAIEEKLGRQEGMAISHANLGTMAHDRNDMPTARTHYQAALQLYERIGIKHEADWCRARLAELDA